MSPADPLSQLRATHRPAAAQSPLGGWPRAFLSSGMAAHAVRSVLRACPAQSRWRKRTRGLSPCALLSPASCPRSLPFLWSPERRPLRCALCQPVLPSSPGAPQASGTFLRTPLAHARSHFTNTESPPLPAPHPPLWGPFPALPLRPSRPGPPPTGPHPCLCVSPALTHVRIPLHAPDGVLPGRSPRGGGVHAHPDPLGLPCDPPAPSALQRLCLGLLGHLSHLSPRHPSHDPTQSRPWTGDDRRPSPPRASPAACPGAAHAPDAARCPRDPRVPSRPRRAAPRAPVLTQLPWMPGPPLSPGGQGTRPVQSAGLQSSVGEDKVI